MDQTRHVEAILLQTDRNSHLERVQIRLTKENLYDIPSILAVIGEPCQSIGLERLDETHYLIYDDLGSSNGQPLNLYFKKLWGKEMYGRLLLLRWEGNACLDMEPADEEDLIEWGSARRRVAEGIMSRSPTRGTSPSPGKIPSAGSP